ncbi:golgin subfamily A member 6-like protein 22 [Pituophis catenifer annectens]|uniref:golgin subfamily A member 6-like protein 22 n=1 Tax=Pituophis catenifer annectens TaxID=94852 RepID=UPI0039920ECB
MGKEKEKVKLEMAPNVIQDMFQKIQETLLQTQEKIAENQEEMRTFHAEIRNEIGEVKEDIKTMKDKIGGIQNSIAENEQRIRKTETKIYHVELKVEAMEQKTLQLNIEMSDSLAMLEMEKASYFLRFQNIPEEKNEDLEGKMVEIIAGMTQKEPKEKKGQLEETYRAQTNYIRKHRLAREVHVKFLKKSIRNEAYKKSREETVTYNDKKIIILK